MDGRDGERGGREGGGKGKGLRVIVGPYTLLGSQYK